MWIIQHARKIKTAATAATVRRLGAHTGTHKSTDKSISGKQQKSNENFSVPCVSVIGLYDNTMRRSSSKSPMLKADRTPRVRLSKKSRVPAAPKGLRTNLNRFRRSLRGQQGSRRSPAKRVRWEKEERRNDRFFALLGGNEGCGACDDAKQDKGMASQAPPQPPLLPAVQAVSGA